MRRLACLLLILAILCSLCFVGDVVHAASLFEGILASDTTWTLAQSPIRLTGFVNVNPGVTLTIEPGVTVDVLYSSISVQGTLIAKGTNQSKILFTTTADRNSGLYYPHGLPAPLYIDSTGPNSIMENVVIADLIRINASMKITKCSLGTLVIQGGESLVFSNDLADIYVNNGSPTITNNTINHMQLSAGTPTIANNTIHGGISLLGGSPMITDNTINGRTYVGDPTSTYEVGSPVFSGNKFFDGIDSFGTTFSYNYNTNTNTFTDVKGENITNAWLTVTNNEFRLANNKTIISVSGMHVNISNNRITGNGNSQPIVNNPFNSTEKQLVPGQCGITVGSYSSNSIVSITGNQIDHCQTAINVFPV